MIFNIDQWPAGVIFLAMIIIAGNFLTVLSHSKLLRVNFYFEPQNLESTQFFKSELLPLFHDARISNQLNLRLVPFGRAKCDPAHQEYNCTCPKGSNECDLMYLMACTLHDHRHHKDALEIISCLQGQLSLSEAHRHCIQNLPIKEASWLSKCTRTFRGKYLSWINGLRTKAIGLNGANVPKVLLNGRIMAQALSLREQVCQELKSSKPNGC